MSTASGRRSQKRIETRTAIANAASRLFIERGFEKVTVDDVASAAGVGRMTIFNHFPRKEDLFFDREAELRELLHAALTDEEAAISPARTLRLLSRRLVAEDSPLVRFSPGSRIFVETIEASETLRARVRAIRDEIASSLACELARIASLEADDPLMHLAAGIVVAAWAAALAQAHRTYARRRRAEEASAVFLALVDRGMACLEDVLAVSPSSSRPSAAAPGARP